jgi:hypothetical protein
VNEPPEPEGCSSDFGGNTLRAAYVSETDAESNVTTIESRLVLRYDTSALPAQLLPLAAGLRMHVVSVTAWISTSAASN